MDLRLVGPNLFIIQFLNHVTRDRVLESEPWHIQNQLLIVRKWELEMKSLKFNMSKPLLCTIGKYTIGAVHTKRFELYC